MFGVKLLLAPSTLDQDVGFEVLLHRADLTHLEEEHFDEDLLLCVASTTS